MKKLWILLFLPFCISCNKINSSPGQEVYSDVDLSDIINSDDYFKLKRKNGNKQTDSLETRLIELNDINNDGKRDSAWIIYNNLNSHYKIRFSCYKDAIILNNISELELKDMNDLNGDGHHEILLFLQSEESCWDEIRLYSWIGKWIEKYNGLTYQCTENNKNNYQFRKIDDHTVQITTYGVNKDSIDTELGDTLENIIPNALNTHLIVW